MRLILYIAIVMKIHLFVVSCICFSYSFCAFRLKYTKYADKIFVGRNKPGYLRTAGGVGSSFLLLLELIWVDNKRIFGRPCSLRGLL